MPRALRQAPFDSAQDRQDKLRRRAVCNTSNIATWYMWFTYIIQCKDGSLYTGATNDLSKRFQAHKQGKGCKYTASHKPLKVVFFEKFKTQSEALKREIEIKKLSHKEKENLVKLSKS